MAKGVELDPAEVEAETGVPRAMWQELMERMKRAKYGALLFGTDLPMTPDDHLTSYALLALARDMNAHTRFVCQPMRGPGNITGADNVVTWRTGYPFAVNLDAATLGSIRASIPPPTRSAAARPTPP